MSQNTALVPRFVNIAEVYNLFCLRCQAERFQPSICRQGIGRIARFFIFVGQP
jgi:hypothetical protein